MFRGTINLLTMKLAAFSLLLLVATSFAEHATFDLNNLISLEPKVPVLPHVNVSFVPGGNRIVGGQPAYPHQFPYQVAIYISVPGGTSFCGGSLISDEWVLTAAHCAAPGNSFTVLLGAHYLNSSPPTPIQRHVIAKYIFPGYTSSPPVNDVALLKLNAKVPLSDFINIVRLPCCCQLVHTLENLLTTVSGWGRDSDSSSSISSILRWVQVPVISNDDCNDIYGIITPGHICTAGTGGKGTCSGDSGGPLVFIESDGKPTQFGVVSFGAAAGCELGHPAGYSRVTIYLPWILAITGIPIRHCICCH